METGMSGILGGWTEMKSKDLLPTAGETSSKDEAKGKKEKLIIC